MLRPFRAVLTLAIAVASAGCTRAADPAPAQPVQPAPEPARAERTPWAAGPLRAPKVTIAFGLRLVGGQKPAAGAALVRKLAARHLPGVAIFDLEAGPPAAPPALGLGATPAGPLRPEELRYFGRGLDDAAKARLAKAWPLEILVLLAEGAKADAALKSLTALVAEAARSLGAVVDDPEARLYYSAREFGDRVAGGGFEGDLPVVLRHTALHSYQTGDGSVRSITLGMSKLGLPDVVVNGHGQHGGPAMQSLINVVGQTMVERGRVDVAGRLDVDLRALRSRTVREPLVATLKKGATGRASLGIAAGKVEGGDAENRLVELTFDGQPGGLVERQEAVLAQVFGAEDEVVGVEHDDALLAESARARARLLALKPAWSKGHEGQHLMVKAPFRTSSGGSEYMWIEVTGWKGTRLRGLLANDPIEVPGLKAGASVEVEEASVFDYTLRRADGTEEGNTTEELLRGR